MRGMSDNQRREFGERLLQVLKTKKITQKELADAVGVSDVTMSRYCKGLREPSGTTLVKIGNYLKVEVNFLLGTSNYPGSDFISQEAYNLCASKIADYAYRWTPEQKCELAKLLFSSIEEL